MAVGGKRVPLAVVVAGLLWLGQAAFVAAEDAPVPTPGGEAVAAAPCPHGPAACAEHHAACAAARASLDEKLAAMDKAAGDAKVEAIAAVLHAMAAGGCAGGGGCTGPGACGAAGGCCGAGICPGAGAPGGCPMMGHGAHPHGGMKGKGPGGPRGRQAE